MSLTSGQWTYSLLIPCFFAWVSRKSAIHAAFFADREKFPVIFPVIRKSAPANAALRIAALQLL